MIITISREYGSGGRFIGRKVAEALAIPFYDREIITEAAKKSGLSSDYIASSDERRPSSLMFDVSSTVQGISSPLSYQSPAPDRVFFAQADAIREFAAKGPCVIVGRCADYILRDTPGLLRVFIHSTVEDKKKRVVEFYDVKPEKAEEQIAKIDKIRIAYRKFYTGEAWNDARIYDLAVNTALLGIDGCVDVIAKAARVLEN